MSVMENRMFFLDYEEARPHLICRLVSIDNEELLRKVPFARAFEDLMAVPCFYQKEEGGRASGSPVTLFQAAQWQVEPGQLLKDAVRNMQLLLPPAIWRMSDLMESPMNGSLRSALIPALKRKFTRKAEGELDQLAWVLARRMGKQIQKKSATEPMWVLGNDAWLFGATSLLFSGVLDAFGQKAGRNFYILPSSVHEVILLPEGRAETKELLYAMVEDASRKMDRTRFLSGHVYYYDRNKMEIQTLKK